GRSVTASPNHPTAGGTPLESLHAGDSLDGAVITTIASEPYHADRTYDLLPAGSTGTYWADGVLLRSTVRDGTLGAPGIPQETGGCRLLNQPQEAGERRPHPVVVDQRLQAVAGVDIERLHDHLPGDHLELGVPESRRSVDVQLGLWGIQRASERESRPSSRRPYVSLGVPVDDECAVVQVHPAGRVWTGRGGYRRRQVAVAEGRTVRAQHHHRRLVAGLHGPAAAVEVEARLAAKHERHAVVLVGVAWDIVKTRGAGAV